jgi:hypothetical protein
MFDDILHHSFDAPCISKHTSPPTLNTGALCLPQIAARLPEVGCAWNSAGPEVIPEALGGVARLWWLRYRTLLR